MLNLFKKGINNTTFSKENNKLNSNFNKTYISELGEPVWMKREYIQFADEAYCRNVIAHRCISLLAKSGSSVEWQALLQNNYSNKKEITKNHALLDLITRPNPLQSGNEFFESLIAFILIAGNCFIQVIKNGNKPTELFILRPDRVSIISNGKSIPLAYRYKINNDEKYYHVDQLTGRSEILHLKHFHPLDDFYGLSPIEAAAYSIDQHNQAAKWNQSLLQNSARPSGALVVKGEGGMPGMLSETQFNRLRNQIDKEFTGDSKIGRPLLLEGGLEWHEMSLTNKDMEFLEAKNSAAREIALAFGVPPQLLGIPGDNTYSNLQEARLALWEETIFPLLDYITNALNHWLEPYYNYEAKLIYNKDNISALSARREMLWQKIEQSNFLTVNEKREILGYGPIKNGDTIKQ
ncbi:MAG: phage portal protein [Sphingobacteriia bacterium]|nr:phage portal protein [Sphingobacteriia bacterium]